MNHRGKRLTKFNTGGLGYQPFGKLRMTLKTGIIRVQKF